MCRYALYPKINLILNSQNLIIDKALKNDKTAPLIPNKVTVKVNI